MLWTSIVETPLNYTTLACVMSKFPICNAYYPRLSHRMLPFIKVGVVRKILLRFLIWLLRIMVPALVPASLYSPLFIIELIPFPHCLFYMGISATHVFRTRCNVVPTFVP